MRQTLVRQTQTLDTCGRHSTLDTGEANSTLVRQTLDTGEADTDTRHNPRLTTRRKTKDTRVPTPKRPTHTNTTLAYRDNKALTQRQRRTLRHSQTTK